MKYAFSLTKKYCSIVFKRKCSDSEDDKGHYKHYDIFNKVIEFMKSIGFEAGLDEEVAERYQTISKDYFKGRKGYLEFKAHRYPTGFKIEFYQNVNTDRGEYEIYKFDKMPYLIKMMFINESKKICRFMEELGYADESKPEYKLAEDCIKDFYVEEWHHKGIENMDFKLSDLDGPSGEPSYNTTDRDGKEILNGQIKYYRASDGRLRRVKVYHNINNMWWCILSDTEYTNVAAFRLFDATEEDFKNRRVVKDRRPYFKYAVITSQYGYSWLSYICTMDLKSYIENAKKVTRDLIAHRSDDKRDAEYLGGLKGAEKQAIKGRYNVNSNGDIYFINANTLEEARDIVAEMNARCNSTKASFNRKGMTESIRKFHKYEDITAIIAKHFEIVEKTNCHRGKVV